MSHIVQRSLLARRFCAHDGLFVVLMQPWQTAIGFRLTPNDVQHRMKSGSSPFRNADTRKIQEVIDRNKGMEYLDMGPLTARQKRGQANEDSFFDKVDLPPTFDTLGSVVSPYVKPANRRFILTPEGLKQRWEGFKNFIVSTYSVGLIKRYVKPFPIRQFAAAAEKIYIETNKAVVSRDKHALRDFTTANISYLLRKNFNSPARMLTWKYIRTVERPRIVHARVAPLQAKDNFFAQVTVRMHTEHVFAVTNRYDRLLQGSLEPRAVVEYVVFERHIANQYGQWRICGKLFNDQVQHVESNDATRTVPAMT